MTDVVDKAGRDYWDATWEVASLPAPADPQNRHVDNTVQLGFDRFFRLAFEGIDPARAEMMEVGCARSEWLPYFAREFGLRVAGLDYSETGCEMARAVLDRWDVDGQIVHADLFDPPADQLNRYDFVCSFGVVEHFTDTARCVAALGRMLRPGGRVITFVPNMYGLVGRLQRWLNPKVFDVHVPLDRLQLAKAHTDAGLRVLHAQYLLTLNLGVVNIENLRERAAYRWIDKARWWTSKLVWMLNRGVPVANYPNRWTSPHVAVVAERLF